MFEGDDGRLYSSEAEWEFAYNEGCKAELLAIHAAEAFDPYCDDDAEDSAFIGPYKPLGEIPF